MDDSFLTVRGQKKIVREIFEEFKTENNINDIQIYPVTVSEYLLDSITTHRFSLSHKSIKEAVEYTKGQVGFFLSSVVIFVDGKNLLRPSISSFLYGCGKNKKRLEDYNYNLENNYYSDSDKVISFVRFVDTVYHELGHVLQKKKNDPYVNFIKDIEKTIKIHDRSHYDKYHDNYYSEIDANVYSSIHTKEYFSNYPEINDKASFFINDMCRYAKKTSNEYNFDDFFNKFYLLLHQKPKEIVLNRLSDVNEKKWFNVFFTSEFEFKNIDYILSYLKFHRDFNMDIAYLILSSTAFISSIDFTDISDDALIAIKSIIEHKKEEYDYKYKSSNSLKFLNSSNNLLPYLERIEYLSSKKSK